MNRGLKVIEEIYDESMYGDKDIYRIKDIIHSLDDNHFRNKKWAADIFFNLYEKITQSSSGKLLVVGGWYGLLAYQLRKRFDDDYQIISADMDPKCAEIGYKLFYDQNIEFETWAIQDQIDYDCSAIFCTSVEHIPPNIIQDLINKKGEHTWIILQSTNMIHKTHINKHNTLIDLEEAFVWPKQKENEWWDFEFSNSQTNGDWHRHMVIGR